MQVPIIEKETQNRALPAARLSPVNNPFIKLDNTKLFDAVQGIADEAKKRGDQVAMVEAQRKMDDWENAQLFDPKTGYLAKQGKDTFGGPATIAGQFDADMGVLQDSLANQEQKDMFQKMAVSRRDTVLKTAYNHERQHMEKFADDATTAAAASGVNRAALYYNQPDILESSIEAAKAAVISRARVKGMSADAVANDLLEVESKARLGALTRMADNDPANAVAFYDKHVTKFTAQDLLSAQNMMTPVKRKYEATKIANEAIVSSMPKTAPDDAINYVMNQLEGGDKVVIDNDGGTTKFGLNSNHVGLKPEAVASLTPEEAVMIYKRDYWQKMGIDKLPADMRLIAFDAAVNHGADEDTKAMIEKANGDPRKLLDLRREYYVKLAKENPEKNGPQLQGWMNRLAKLSAQVDAMRGEVPDEAELASKIDGMTGDIEVAKDAKQLISNHIAVRQEARKRSWEAASEEAWNYVNNGMEVPASVEARMSQADVNDMRNKRAADPDTYAAVRQAVVAGQDIDLKAYRWKLGNKYTELVELQQDPDKNVTAKVIDQMVKDATPFIIGNRSDKLPANAMKLDNFRRAATAQIEQAQRNKGAKLTEDEKRQIADRLLLDVRINNSGIFGDDTAFMFEVGNREAYVKGIRSDGTYMIGGQQATYADLIDTLFGEAQRRNVRPTSDVLKDIFDELRQPGGVITWRAPNG